LDSDSLVHLLGLGTEAVSLKFNKSAINKLDNCIKLAVAKIFNVKDGNIDAVRDF